MKKEISVEFELKETKLNGTEIIRYNIIVRGECLDCLVIDHEMKKVHTSLLSSVAKILGLEKHKDYEECIKFFGITPPLTQADAIYKIHAMIDEINGDWKPDWNNDNELKYYLYYNHLENRTKVGRGYVCCDLGKKNCKDDSELRKLIQNNEQLLKIAFGIENE